MLSVGRLRGKDWTSRQMSYDIREKSDARENRIILCSIGIEYTRKT